MARRANSDQALPTVWQCPDERQWLCPLAGKRHGWLRIKKARQSRANNQGPRKNSVLWISLSTDDFFHRGHIAP